MRFFEFETYLTSDEIQHRMSSYYEWEKHSSWNIFKEYTSPRKGLHIYPDENGFTGYYETGERNRHYDLQKAKAWVHIKIKEKNGKRIVKGYTYYCPLLIIGLLIGLLEIIFVQDILAFILISVVCAVLFMSKIKEENVLQTRNSPLSAPAQIDNHSRSVIVHRIGVKKNVEMWVTFILLFR